MKLRNSRLTAPVSLLAAAGLVLMLLGGCFETTLNLGSAADAKVDKKFVGEWAFKTKGEGDKEMTTNLIVRNFDDKQYYAEWTEEGQKPQRMRGHLVPIKSATFIQLTNLADDGYNPDKHLIVRLELEGAKLTLRHLNDKFFEGVTTDEALKAKVEANLDNTEMYAEVATGTRSYGS